MEWIVGFRIKHYFCPSKWDGSGAKAGVSHAGGHIRFVRVQKKFFFRVNATRLPSCIIFYESKGQYDGLSY